MKTVAAPNDPYDGIPIIILMLILSILGTISIFGQTTYTSNGTSTNWSTSTAWTPTGVPNVGSWPYDLVVVNNNMTCSSSIALINNEYITINSGATLNILSDLTLGSWGSPTITIVSGGHLIVHGNLIGKGSATSLIIGDVSVLGNLTNEGSSKLILNGITTVNGDVSTSGYSNLVVNNTLAVSKSISLITSSYLTGIGVVSWSTFSTDNSGSYMQCVDGTKWDTDPNSSPQTPSPISKSINLNQSCVTKLPIELLEWGGEHKISYNLLHWTTAKQINNDYFSLERSEDCKTWITIIDVDGDNDNNIHNYNYIDAGITTTYYYRLKQTDFDGKYAYFNVKVLTFRGDAAALLYRFDIQGRQVTNDYGGIIIKIYNDGTAEKIEQ